MTHSPGTFGTGDVKNTPGSPESGIAVAAAN